MDVHFHSRLVRPTKILLSQQICKTKSREVLPKFLTIKELGLPKETTEFQLSTKCWSLNQKHWLNYPSVLSL